MARKKIERLSKEQQNAIWAKLSSLHYRTVLSYSLFLTRNPVDAQDLAQEVFGKSLPKALKEHKLDAPESPQMIGWLKRNAWYLHQKWLRKERLKNPIQHSNSDEVSVQCGKKLVVLKTTTDTDPEKDFIASELGISEAEMYPTLREEIATLPFRSKTILLAALDGKDLKEAAKAIGMPEDQVSKYFYRGIESLKKRLSETYPQYDYLTKYSKCG